MRRYRPIRIYGVVAWATLVSHLRNNIYGVKRSNKWGFDVWFKRPVDSGAGLVL